MRSGVTAGGIFLMIIGIGIAFLWSGEPEGGTLTPPIIGGGIGFIGFLTFIAGLAASSPKEKPTEIKEEKTKEVAICPDCKSRIPVNSKFCPECGTDLRREG